MLKGIVLSSILTLALLACGTTKKAEKKNNVSQQVVVVSKTDTGKTAQPFAYNKVITSKAITKKGLFTVHQIGDKWYFEIPDSLLFRDILIVNRISKAATEARDNYQSMLGYAGDQIGQNVVQFSKGPGNKLFIKSISFLERSYDSTENGMYRALQNSNLLPILTSFDIKAFTPDSAGMVIDVTDYINGDNDVLFFDPFSKRNLGLGAFQKDKSYVNTINAYPLNVEIKTIKTYGTNSVGTRPEEWAHTYELNSSIVLLPKKPMQPRYWDTRISYFWERYRDFDVTSGVTAIPMIKRWRLEPRLGDEEKYKRGELVEPQKPIVFYIDPATPKKWVPYLIQGVNDWQKAFEKAGFKNAIYALEAPKDDSTWSLEDARHNFIVYKASTIKNASGPNINDPRTGEILESHINWYHNVVTLVHDWYMIQAGPLDPRARKMEFDDSLMGELIHFVCSHEVGHTLGLEHNFGASATIPVDSLRSKAYVETNGFCPSIMDYARFNYVAQPEDSISAKGIFPRIGVYDQWMINLGYRWLPQFKTAKEESVYLKQWITETVGNNNQLQYGPQGNYLDPRCRAEDLGDDPMKAGNYGIKNLKRVMAHLPEWTYLAGEDYWNLRRLQEGVLEQYDRYLGNVVSMIGGVYSTQKIVDEKGGMYKFVPGSLQRKAFQFLNEQLFKTPNWLVNEEIWTRTGEGIDIIYKEQEKVLNSVISSDRLYLVNKCSDSLYTVNDLLNDCKNAIWEELKRHKPIDQNRRNLQRLHIYALQNYFSSGSKSKDLKDDLYYNYDAKTDIPMLIRAQIKELQKDINRAIPGYKDRMSITYLTDVEQLLRKILAQNVGIPYSPISSKATGLRSLNSQLSGEVFNDHSQEGCDMWQ